MFSLIYYGRKVAHLGLFFSHTLSRYFINRIFFCVDFFPSRNRNETNGQEIYMYDIGTKIVSRLKGELSNAFVNVAESNANAQDDDDDDNSHENIKLIDSGIYEKMPAMTSEHEKITIIQAQTPSIQQHQPHHNRPIFRRDNSQTIKSSNDDPSKISISSGYSVIKR